MKRIEFEELTVSHPIVGMYFYTLKEQTLTGGPYEIYCHNEYMAIAYFSNGYIHRDNGYAILRQISADAYYLIGMHVGDDMFQWIKQNNIKLPFENIADQTLFKLTWDMEQYGYMFEWWSEGCRLSLGRDCFFSQS